MQVIYFDNAATTPMSNEVIDAITKVFKTTYGNPSSTHQFGRKAKSLVEQSRKNIAKHFNVTASEIVFTSGGSEADNLILHNAVLNLGVTRIITSKIEHHAVLHTVDALQKEHDIQVNFVKLNNYGAIDYSHLEELLKTSQHKTLISLMYVNNEIGNLLNLDIVCNISEKYNALFHSDTVQGIGHFKIDLQKHPIDFITASAHKFHGPKGTGFAIIKKGFGVKPILLGGEQERGARAGTENVASIVGMEIALNNMLAHLPKEQEYITSLKLNLIEQLKHHFKGILFNGYSDKLDKSSYIILNVRFPKEIPMLLFSLDLKGIAVSGGSACQSGSNKGSHVLNTILNEEEALKTSVRFSFSKLNTKEEIVFLIDELKLLLS